VKAKWLPDGVGKMIALCSRFDYTHNSEAGKSSGFSYFSSTDALHRYSAAFAESSIKTGYDAVYSHRFDGGETASFSIRNRTVRRFVDFYESKFLRGSQKLPRFFLPRKLDGVPPYPPIRTAVRSVYFIHSMATCHEGSML